jgi:hypothetical protein
MSRHRHRQQRALATALDPSAVSTQALPQAHLHQDGAVVVHRRHHLACKVDGACVAGDDVLVAARRRRHLGSAVAAARRATLRATAAAYGDRRRREVELVGQLGGKVAARARQVHHRRAGVLRQPQQAAHQARQLVVVLAP